MPKPTRKLPVVTVLVAGAGLTVGGACHKDGTTSNPPPPPEVPTGNPPVPDVPPPGTPPQAEQAAALPTWDQVESGHPKGATNPPLPLLVVSADGEHCWKEWLSPMRPGPDNMVAIKHGGKVLDGGEASAGTEIQCPDKAAEVLEKARAESSGG